jgi:hypothetical protein
MPTHVLMATQLGAAANLHPGNRVYWLTQNASNRLDCNFYVPRLSRSFVLTRDGTVHLCRKGALCALSRAGDSTKLVVAHAMEQTQQNSAATSVRVPSTQVLYPGLPFRGTIALCIWRNVRAGCLLPGNGRAIDRNLIYIMADDHTWPGRPLKIL